MSIVFAAVFATIALAAALGLPLAAVVLWLMEKSGAYWWLYAWLIWVAFNLLVLAVYPTWIAPLFNKFVPLDDPQLKERIERLLDKDSFHEIGAIAGKAQYDEAGRLIDFMASNFVMGRGRIDGRTVAVGGDDFTVRGGAADASIWEKQMMSEQMAGELGIPMVRLVDGTGGGGSVKTYEMSGFTYVPRNPGWEFVVDNLARVPVVSLGLGSVAGLGAARLATSHYSLMVKGISQMFVAGPPVVARLGEKVTKEELGGTDIHGRNGAVDDEVDSEDEAFARTRRFLSYLPSSIDSLAGVIKSNREQRRSAAEALSNSGVDKYDIPAFLRRQAD